MWISDPTPVTTSSIILRRLSHVNPSGTRKIPGISIQVCSVATMFGCRNINQLQTKLAITAATETRLLSARDRRRNSVIDTAETSGQSRTCHGRVLFMSSELQTRNVFHVRGLSGAVQRHNDCQPNGDFGG